MNNLTKNIIALAVRKMIAYGDYKIENGVLYLIETKNDLIPESITIAGHEDTVLKLYNKKIKEKRNVQSQSTPAVR